MEEHTPGPFTVEGPSDGALPYDDGGDYAIRDADGKIIAETYEKVGRLPNGEYDVRSAEANAILFAAAPDLLAALEAVEWVNEEDFSPYCPWCNAYQCHGHRPDCQRQAAIAKARGER